MSDNTVEASVVRATSEVADGLVDWGLLLEICDMVTNDPGLAPRLVTAIEARLKVKDPKVQKLAVILVETCVKNCGDRVHLCVGTKSFLSAVASVGETSTSRETRDAALKVVEQWGVAFEPRKDQFPAFVEIYANLKVRGVAFPPQNDDDVDRAPVFTPPQQDERAAKDLRDEEDMQAAMDKLNKDIGVVAEKVALCLEMVPNSPGVGDDDALAEVVGFLEACRPRMLDLIDAGSRGAISDQLLALALKVNDDLGKALDAEKSHAAANALALAQGGATTPPLGGGGGGPPFTAAAPVPAPLAQLSIGDDDDDEEDLRRGAATKAPPQPPVIQSASSDLLDLTAFDDATNNATNNNPSRGPPQQPQAQPGGQPDLLL